MISVNSLFHSVFGGSISAQATAQHITPAQIEQDEEQIFLASIANLAPEERQARLQRREFYRLLVERQARMDIEQRAQNAWR